MTGQVWQDPSMGWGFFDDFADFYATANKYTLVEGDAASTVGLLATEVGGVLRLDCGNVDNDEVYISAGTEAGLVKIDGAAGRVWMEARIRTDSIADNAAGLFIGLTEEGWSAANAMTDDTGVVGDKDTVGFAIVQADGNAITAIHNTASGGGVTTAIASVQVPVASTWYKLGLYFDGVDTVSWFVNGVANATTVLESATNFPDGEELHLSAGAKTGSAVGFNVDIDWWAVAQEAV
jgi:hypothetical protein